MIRTSKTHPLQIAEVSAPGSGRIGITFCPGKVQPAALSGCWERDLGLDLDAIRDWGASAVITLLESRELERLQVPSLGEEVRTHHMDWFHLPIRDASAPGTTFENRWALVGPQVRARLQAGFDVLVHCKGGLGRAGTIAARLLVELGVAPEDAIRMVRAVRPGAIETAAQERHVEAQRLVTEAVPNTSLHAIRDRALGALLGLAVGDAVGTTLEFKRRDTYPVLVDMIGGGPFRLRPGEWTDDTAMALALADSLGTCEGLDEADLMRRFAAWRDTGAYSCNGRCFDIGMTVSRALSRWQRSGNPIAGDTDPNTAGNGSLMRLAPVAVRYWNDRGRLVDAAARQSKITHGAAEAVDACVAWAEIMADAIAGKPLDEILRLAAAVTSPKIATILAGSWRGLDRGALRASGYVVHSLEAALWSIGRSGGDYRNTVLAAANLGEDADTTAAIAGQLAGAIQGVRGIPRQWLDRLVMRKRIAALAERLFSISVGIDV